MTRDRNLRPTDGTSAWGAGCTPAGLMNAAQFERQSDRTPRSAVLSFPLLVFLIFTRTIHPRRPPVPAGAPAARHTEHRAQSPVA